MLHKSSCSSWKGNGWEFLLAAKLCLLLVVSFINCLEVGQSGQIFKLLCKGKIRIISFRETKNNLFAFNTNRCNSASPFILALPLYRLKFVVFSEEASLKLGMNFEHAYFKGVYRDKLLLKSVPQRFTAVQWDFYSP